MRMNLLYVRFLEYAYEAEDGYVFIGNAKIDIDLLKDLDYGVYKLG